MNRWRRLPSTRWGYEILAKLELETLTRLQREIRRSRPVRVAGNNETGQQAAENSRGPGAGPSHNAAGRGADTHKKEVAPIASGWSCIVRTGDPGRGAAPVGKLYFTEG